MKLSRSDLTIGIEEEYLLVDIDSRDLVTDPPPALMEECVKRCGEQVSPELMRSQIEVGTRVCRSVQEAATEVRQLRTIIAEVAGKFGYAPIAASTHPFAHWFEQKQTDKDRYAALTLEMQAAARRLLISGMHVHVGIEQPELRVDLMNQLSYFLPHMLALSCSSPFWEGYDTGLKSYRLTVFDALPRTGLPDQFASYGEYERHIAVMVNAGVMEDASKIWWDLRPSSRFPTLETRIMDVCTNVEDTIALAALNVCVLRMLYRLRRNNQRWRVYSTMLINENRWRAMRYSFDQGLIDFAKGKIVPYRDLLEEVIGFVKQDAEELDCFDEIVQLRNILDRGTSAHHQLNVFATASEQGKDHRACLNDVVDWLIQETVAGI